MALENRVLPDGCIVREGWRGTLMGNRGGRIHNPQTRSLLHRRWASRRWIICVTEFKGRHRKVMGPGYTELFFLDEVSALAAGHRPCFECRREAANRFAGLWETCFGPATGSRADTIDRHLHAERTGAPSTMDRNTAEGLPDGSMVAAGGRFYARLGNGFKRWSGSGYVRESLPEGECRLLTPPATLAVLREGYRPEWHVSALEEASHGHS